MKKIFKKLIQFLDKYMFKYIRIYVIRLFEFLDKYIFRYVSLFLNKIFKFLEQYIFIHVRRFVKKLLQFLDRHLGYVLIIPALFFVLAFSLVPVVESLRYAFFDFQLNDQQKNNIYLSEHYNIELANEDIFYLEFHLENEKSNLQNQSTRDDIDNFINKVNSEHALIIADIGSSDGVVKINKEQYKNIEKFNTMVKSEVNRILSTTGETFTLSDDIKAVAFDLDKTLINENFIGFDNFIRAMKDSRMWSTTGITLIFTIVSVFFELILGLSLALIMNISIKGKGFVRTTSLIPWAIPTSVAALMWLYMFNGDSGVIAMILAKLNIIEKPSVLMGSGRAAFIAITIADIWKTTPYMALMLLAGLQTIPNTLYESSSIDGANRLQQFSKITLPLLKPSILVALLFRTLDAFRVFDLIYVLTGGGPGGQTESISIYAYKVLKSQTVLGYGSTLVIFMAIVVGIISFIYIKILGVKVAKEV